MAAAPTYGVTPAVVAARIHGFAPSTTSRPTTAQIESFIDEVASFWHGTIVDLGVRPGVFSDDPTSTGYKVSAQYVTLAACVETVRANERASTSALLSFESSAKAMFDRVVKRPSVLMEGQPVTPAANTSASHVTLRQQIRPPAGLGARMARQDII